MIKSLAHQHKVILVLAAIPALLPANGVVASPASSRLSTERLVADSALILRAKATKVDPRAFDAATKESFTHVVLTVVEKLAGDWPAPTIEFLLRGGLVPSGRFEQFSELPIITEGNVYLLFVRAGEYKLSPFTELSSVFREIDVAGRPGYVDGSGRAVVRLGERGIEVGDYVADSEFLLITRTFGWSFERASSITRAPDLSRMLRRDEVLTHIKSRIASSTGSKGGPLFMRPSRLEYRR